MLEKFQRFISQRVRNSSFFCVQCGNCCKFTEIIISNREIGAISHYLNIPNQKFIENYLIKKEINIERNIFSNKFEIRGEILILKKDNQNICPFYTEIEKKAFCKIYNFRPIVCRLFPFTWKTSEYNPNSLNVAIDFSENGWNKCKGINNNGQSWEDLRDEVTGAVILSIIQSNELIIDGFLTQVLKK